jgi:4-methylaminobutanoate oxidase (formaldehyde-forming)
MNCRSAATGPVPYFREENAVMLGAFQNFSKPWMVESTQTTFFTNYSADWKKFAETARERKTSDPGAADGKVREIRQWPGEFHAGQQFLMGETPELRNLFVLAGFNSVGIASAPEALESISPNGCWRASKRWTSGRWTSAGLRRGE